MEDEEALPISALSHLVYCPRRAALVHVLGLWAENVHTVSGQLVHERIDSGETTSRPGLTILRSVHVRSERLGFRGIIDALEVHGDGAAVKFLPIETKRGGKRQRSSDDIQLCAQAMALEEMTGKEIAEGAIFHAASKRRRVVKLTASLREATERAAARLHEIIAKREVPPPVRDERCPPCSLVEICQPHDESLAPTLREALARSLT